ncbi:MAG TPA: hypothetical protein VN721_17325 [Flavipsychrobacter sp.]|nr:hypothetical protein [Flavipsychrobacter sp.]
MKSIRFAIVFLVLMSTLGSCMVRYRSYEDRDYYYLRRHPHHWRNPHYYDKDPHWY